MTQQSFDALLPTAPAGRFDGVTRDYTPGDERAVVLRYLSSPEFMVRLRAEAPHEPTTLDRRTRPRRPRTGRPARIRSAIVDRITGH
mgnify:CR=1 FL=1